jgi:hypothetical protein
METQKDGGLLRDRLPTALSLPVHSNGISARPVPKGQLMKIYTARRACERPGTKERSTREIASSLSVPGTLWKSRLLGGTFARAAGKLVIDGEVA